ncbi:MAG: hypothetical protein JSV88_32355 [Candidatus Aminicenantes bacterium]|nr:MAG: hypothetical protein JSV88_32355 [Candidatus Aminicenantes bacterium]
MKRLGCIIASKFEAIRSVKCLMSGSMMVGQSWRGKLPGISMACWFLECMQGAIEDSQRLIAGVLVKAAFWQKHAQIPISRHQRKVINRMLDAEPNGFKGGLTTRKYVSMAKVSRATAYREISHLVKNGILAPNQGKGRSISYHLVIEKQSDLL